MENKKTISTTKKVLKLTEPKDLIATNRISLLMLNQSTLDDIFKICLPVADDSEFQVHYRSATFECVLDEALLSITLPTVFYNFEQTVAYSSVDYHLDDLTAAAELIKPLSISMMNSTEVADIYAYLDTIFDNVSLLEIADNSFHRHPGRFSFSSIDYDKDPTNPGVIYRKAQSDDIAQTDSVIFWSGRGEIITSETRYVTCEPHADGGVDGHYLELPTITSIYNDSPSLLSKVFKGHKGKDARTTIESREISDTYDLIDDIILNIENILIPTTQFVFPENIEEKVWGRYPKAAANKDAPRLPATTIPWDYTQEEINMAESIGYDLSNVADAEEWDIWGDNLMEGAAYVQ